MPTHSLCAGERTQGRAGGPAEQVLGGAAQRQLLGQMSIQDYLAPMPKVDSTKELPWGMDWPWEYCTDCGDSQSEPFERWSLDRQSDALFGVFHPFPAFLVNIVSDESLIKSTLRFYDLESRSTVTETDSTHVDWTRGPNGGHPGVYHGDMLAVDPTFIRKVRSTLTHACDPVIARRQPLCAPCACMHACTERPARVQRVRMDLCDMRHHSLYNAARRIFTSAGERRKQEAVVQSQGQLQLQTEAGAGAPGGHMQHARRLSRAPQPRRSLAAAPTELQTKWLVARLPLACPLFARKFAANSSDALADFFQSCDQLGLNRSCVEEAAQFRMQPQHLTALERLTGAQKHTA
jgi:hypothetical protein